MGEILILATVVAVIIVWRIRQKMMINYGYIDNYQFSENIRNGVLEKYPHLESSELEKVLKGLKQFFVVCGKNNLNWCTMPSKVVDEAWHQFILNTREYEIFCKKSFGRMLHHSPAEPMTDPKTAQLGIKRAWQQACKVESINPSFTTRIPLLFSLDRTLNIPGGYFYVLNCDLSSYKGENKVYCAGHIGSQSGAACGGGGCGGGCGGS